MTAFDTARLEVARLLLRLRTRGLMTAAQHAAALARAEAEVEALPAVQEYRQAEAATRRLFQVVDALISQEAGVAFAENAQRSGCGCGG